MEPFKSFFSRASPTVKTMMAISITTAGVVVYKWWYAPLAKRARYRQAEEWANMIVEQEERMEQEGVVGYTHPQKSY